MEALISEVGYQDHNDFGGVVVEKNEQRFRNKRELLCEKKILI
jgi:hypothetical protein